MELISHLVLGIQRVDVELLRRFCFMRMSRAFVDAEIAHQGPLGRTSRNHSTDGCLDHSFGKLAIEDLMRLALFDAAGVAGMAVICLVLTLAAGKGHFFGIDDDYVVAAVDMRCEQR